MRESKKIRDTENSLIKMAAEDVPADPREGFTRRNVGCLLILFFVNLVNYMDRYTVSSILDVSTILL